MRSVKVGAIYRHFKGSLYLVESIAINTETGEPMVIYMSLRTKEHYARPLDMFLSEVDHDKYPKADQKNRFEILIHEVY